MKGCLLSVILILFFASHATEADDEVTIYMKRAQEHIAIKDYNSAIASLNKIVSITNDQKLLAKTNNAIGWAYYSGGNAKEAIEYLDKALKISIDAGENDIAARATNNLGLIEFSLGNYSQAKNYFRDELVKNTVISQEYLPLIEKQENLMKSNEYVSEGIVHRLNKNFDEAISNYDKALELTPNNQKILEYKGYALFRLKRYDESLEVLNAAYLLDNNNLNISVNIIKSYCGSGNYDGAISFIKNNESILASSNVIRSDGELLRVCNEKVVSIFGKK